jgi:alcohol dehydrogenase (NADP+)
MLCGGITVYSPLRNNGCGPGKRVGIVGIGGLGHFGLLFAKALGADEVVAISRTSSKKEDSLKMGATKFIATDGKIRALLIKRRTNDVQRIRTGQSTMPTVLISS